MSAAPVFNQVNILARDWDASLAFYRLLGFEMEGGHEWPAGSGGRHVGVPTPAGESTIEFDNPPMVRHYAEDTLEGASAILGFRYATASEVDAACARVSSAGHNVLKPPHDAFWGARYALVRDPDGNTIGLMGPRTRR